MSSEKISEKEIKKLLEEDQLYSSVPTINIGNFKLSSDLLIISIFSIILWISLWIYLGLFKLKNYNIIFFVLFIALLIFNLFNASLNIQKSVENAAYDTQNQIVKAEGLLGVVILFFVFLFNIVMDNDIKIIVYKILTVILILLSISIISLETQNNSTNIRNIRLLMTQFYNQGNVLFIFSLYLTYIGIIKK